MTLIKIAKTGQKITVEGCWVCMDGKRVAHEVNQIDPWTRGKLDKSQPGHGLEYIAGNILFTAEDGLKAKTLIEAAKAEQKAKEEAEDKAEFEALVASGRAFRTVEITEQYGCDLMWARRFTAEEKSQYSDWFKNRGVCSLPAGGRIKVERKAVQQVVAGRTSDAEFCGCSNMAWTITEGEWDEIVRLSQEIEGEKEKASKENEKAAAESLQRKIDTGYCFNCESWCHGDCGNYSQNPATSFRRDLKKAQDEANFGINEG